ncbi:4'-phosphopantetheinyl transferase HetI [Hyella patelloides LEGE 07179]|uniref:4'-phosphopantetheinyl transferase HetI n=1 Tax=Hyella patelloides LEGE 07179 TaxID=945734 RepID=A0A563W5I8_9CYAN|nr:4'-phosphopantetheinyl transferase superfamily protein [Hyella patelloides]VEP18946.1 4'-phosphopantetheinyl transferase HetI [Hyella patelloides LEGE 07179]
MKIINRDLNWEKPPSSLKIFNNNQVHLWRANLKIPTKQITELNNILSLDEKERAERFRFPQHRNRFVAARGFLRQIISGYLNIASQEIVFSYGGRGKPKLANSNLQFNISHSQDIALYAFTNHQLIGIDVEYLRSNVECHKIAQRFFTSAESQLITSLSKEKQTQTFFHLWTVKEAYLKAIGEGLVGGLETVEIDVNQTSKLKILAISGEQAKADNWLFSSFIPHNDFIATVAINTQEQALKSKNFALN